MILNDKEIALRLSSPDNIINKLSRMDSTPSVIIKPIHPKPANQGKDLPPLVKDLIAGITNSTSETQAEVAAAFDVSVGTVNQASRGLVGNRVDERLTEAAKPVILTKENTAHESALDAMVSSLGLLNQKLPTVQKPTELARIAREMSTISSNIKGKGRSDENDPSVPKVQVILFAPQNQKAESQYETLDV